jgi:hypothetical protein
VTALEDLQALAHRMSGEMSHLSHCAAAPCAVLAPESVQPSVPKSEGVHLPFAGTTPEAAIARLAAAMNRFEGLEIKAKHYRAGGVLAREVTMPAGTLVASHIHRTEHLCTVSSGELTVFQTDAGTRRHEAPYTFLTAPGAQRVGYCHTDVTWTTYHLDIPGDDEEVERVLYLKQELPEYTEGDAEVLAEWLGALPALLEENP